MKNKTLQVADNLQERIPYSSRFPALSICSDHFDDYFRGNGAATGTMNLSLP